MLTWSGWVWLAITIISMLGLWADVHRDKWTASQIILVGLMISWLLWLVTP